VSNSATVRQASRPEFVIGPQGTPITLGTLPAPPVGRWVALRKAEVVAAVHGGLLSTEQACAMYGLAPQELESWQAAIESLGVRGLFIKNADTLRKVKRRSS
jgi:hypothetical protein